MARKNTDSTAPSSGPATPTKVKKTRWYHQVWQAYQMARRSDPQITLWVLAAFIGTIAIALVVGVLAHQVVYFSIMGLPFASLAGLFVLARRAENAAFAQIEGQPGAALSAVKTIRRGWTFSDEPVAVEARNKDMIFRGVGRPGVVLISEAPQSRATRQLDAERKRTARILPNVPITLIQVGNEEGQVPLRKVAAKVRRLKPTLTKPELAQVMVRLNALGGVRLPIPKGIDPTRARPDRKGMRGR